LDPIKKLLQHPTRSGFLSLVRHHCSGFGIGDSTVGNLLSTDPAFQRLTVQLYRGDISNDEYINRVLEMHPAADANVPGTGCVVNQLQHCLSGRCEVVSGASSQPVATGAEGDAGSAPPLTLDPEPVDGTRAEEMVGDPAAATPTTEREAQAPTQEQSRDAAQDEVPTPLP
jgi:hypothetical protein